MISRSQRAFREYDAMCRNKAPTADLIRARARLRDAVDHDAREMVRLLEGRAAGVARPQSAPEVSATELPRGVV